jgi:predicted metalloprotease with PDZ domain
LYWQYYKKLKRGFSDAEFQQACETIAENSLIDFFEYVYTTKELDYNKYLAFGGLSLEEVSSTDGKSKRFHLKRLGKMDALQLSILKSWLGE